LVLSSRKISFEKPEACFVSIERDVLDVCDTLIQTFGGYENISCLIAAANTPLLKFMPTLEDSDSRPEDRLVLKKPNSRVKGEQTYACMDIVTKDQRRARISAKVDCGNEKGSYAPSVRIDLEFEYDTKDGFATTTRLLDALDKTYDAKIVA